MLLARKAGPSGVSAHGQPSGLVAHLAQGLSRAVPTMDRRAFLRRSGLGVGAGIAASQLTLVKKAQDKGKTQLAFELLRANNILPMPMMMHHDSQPLVSWKSDYGLINQARLLRRAGATTVQVLMLIPAAGSKWYENVFDSGLAFRKVGNTPVEPHVVDGNYVVASSHPRP